MRSKPPGSRSKRAALGGQLGALVDGALVALAHQLDDAVGVLIGLELDRDPARALRREAMFAGLTGLDQLGRSLGPQRQVRDPVPVQVTELASADREAHAAEAAGERQKAAGYYAKLMALAKNADSPRPELAHAKAYVAQR